MAQIRQPGRPIADRAGLPAEVPTLVLPAQDFKSLRAANATWDFGPLRYGVAIEAAQDCSNHGRWDEVPDGGPFVWRLRIASPGAYSLGVVFQEFELPPGAAVYLYDDARTHVLGAYTAANNLASGMLAIEPLAGDAVTIEYVQERWVSATPRLAVGEVIHDFLDLYGQKGFWSGGAGGGGPDLVCFIDVNCPEGAPYQVVKRCVVRALSGGGGCSASLVNNTANDGTPYLLTANHCGDFTNAVVVFNFELPECNNGSAPTTQTISGATVLAANSNFDSQLYLLSSAPPPEYHAYLAGWERNSTTPAPGVSISHPQGLPKKIAIDDSGAVASGTYWAVTWDKGVVAGGSSGSPLFNGLGQVLGPACCVNSFTCGVQTTFYGRLAGFWNATSIAQHLDPLGTGALAIGGHDPCPAPAAYCTAKTNSCGGTPRISWEGAARASATSGFTLSASGARHAKAGLVLYTPNGAQLPAAPFQGGLLCISSQDLRRGVAVVASGGTPGSCDAAFTLDWSAFAAGALGGNPAAFLQTVGQRIDAQWWGRDTLAHDSFLSDALQYVVCP
jgi:hypothetical protein